MACARNVRRKGEIEARTAMSGAGVCGDPPAMRLDDRAANREAHAHAVFPGREEALEKMSEMLGFQARSAVFYSAAHRRRVRHRSRDRHPALRTSRLFHRLYRVES